LADAIEVPAYQQQGHALPTIQCEIDAESPPLSKKGRWRTPLKTDTRIGPWLFRHLGVAVHIMAIIYSCGGRADISVHHATLSLNALDEPFHFLGGIFLL
jgi:hypothetical protein